MLDTGLNNDILKTLIHELRHAYQNAAIDNPVLYIDPEGTSVKMMIFTLSDWRDESNNVLNDFKSYYVKSGETVSCLWTITNNMDSLESMWNNMGPTDFVVINTHAKPSVLGNGKGYGRSSCKAYWFSGALGKILNVANLVDYVESKEYFASYK